MISDFKKNDPVGLLQDQVTMRDSLGVVRKSYEKPRAKKTITSEQLAKAYAISIKGGSNVRTA